MEQRTNTIFNDDFFLFLSKDLKELKSNNNILIDLVKILQNKVDNQEKKILELSTEYLTLKNKINEVTVKENFCSSPQSPSTTYYRPIINITSGATDGAEGSEIQGLQSNLSPRVLSPKINGPILPNLPSISKESQRSREPIQLPVPGSNISRKDQTFSNPKFQHYRSNRSDIDEPTNYPTRLSPNLPTLSQSIRNYSPLSPRDYYPKIRSPSYHERNWSEYYDSEHI